jgi:transcriptional regulator with XRE-family HTH domain
MAIEKSAKPFVLRANICVRVGATIRRLRLSKGWTQQVLADHAAIERSHLARLEEGKREAGIIILERIAQALDVPCGRLFD